MAIPEGAGQSDLKEVMFKFKDNSELIVRPKTHGDTIMGPIAHKYYHDMRRYFVTNVEDLNAKVRYLIRAMTKEM